MVCVCVLTINLDLQDYTDDNKEQNLYSLYGVLNGWNIRVG